MEQEKFEQHLMDYLFDELDEVTRAAMRRQLEADADCRALEAGLRRTIEGAELPLEEPDEDLEERILAAARLAEEGEALHRKLLRSLSWAGSFVMRPQLAMAALLVLVLGSSILLLRAKPGAVGVEPGKDPARAAEALPATAAADDEPAAVARAARPDATALPGRKGAPSPGSANPQSAAAQNAAAQSAGVQAAASASAATKLADGDVDKTYDRGLGNYQAGNYGEARRDFALVAAAGGAKAATAALYEARAVRAQSGCQAAIKAYERVRARYGMGGVGADAAWEQADCHQQLGQNPQAQALLVALTKNPQYKARAVSELSGQGTAAGSGGKPLAAQRKAKAKAKPAPPKAKPSADAPASSF